MANSRGFSCTANHTGVPVSAWAAGSAPLRKLATSFSLPCFASNRTHKATRTMEPPALSMLRTLDAADVLECRSTSLLDDHQETIRCTSQVSPRQPTAREQTRTPSGSNHLDLLS